MQQRKIRASLLLCSSSYTLSNPLSKSRLLRAATLFMSLPRDGSSDAVDNKTCSNLIPLIDKQHQQILEDHGITIEPISPLGARVSGLDVKTIRRNHENEPILAALEMEMARRGFLVFPDLGVMTPEEQINASVLWGGREMHSTHGVHPETPQKYGAGRHIMRLGNDRQQAILGVGPQWHNDGSFLPNTFSHAGYHIVNVPRWGGGTIFCHQGAAYDMLPLEKQEWWSRLVSVNSNSGHLHPVVHKHYLTGRKSLWLHLGMTGAVIEYIGKKGDGDGSGPFRLLSAMEMKELMNEYNDIMNAGLERGYAINYEYKAGDLVMIDNLAIGHKASVEAHESLEKRGLRIMHRTTVKGVRPFAPRFGLPQAADIHGPNPFESDGVWEGGGLGFRWDDNIHMQN